MTQLHETSASRNYLLYADSAFFHHSNKISLHLYQPHVQYIFAANQQQAELAADLC
jgi:hypothetical protein